MMLLMYEFLVRIECEADEQTTYGDVATNAAGFQDRLRAIGKPELRGVIAKKDE